MNAQEIIEYIRTSVKKTPVKVYVWEDTPVEFPNCHVFHAAEGQKIVFPGCCCDQFFPVYFSKLCRIHGLFETPLNAAFFV